MTHEVPRGSATGIVGAEEVWASGGKVYIVDIQPGPDGKKFSTTGIIEALLNESHNSRP